MNKKTKGQTLRKLTKYYNKKGLSVRSERVTTKDNLKFIKIYTRKK